jgi:hypothetical protein
MKKENTNGNGVRANGNVKAEIKEFDFGKSEIADSLIKALTTTRKRLYPERYDSKGRLKPEYAKNNI